MFAAAGHRHVADVGEQGVEMLAPTALASWAQGPGWVKASNVCDVVLPPVASSSRRRRIAVSASIVVSSLSVNVKGSAALRLGGCMKRAQDGMTCAVITGRPTAAIHAVARLMSPPRHRRARRALGQRREPVPVIA